ncbi:MAG: bifunctional 2-polyprenyl-6-hydroxyphenol methylase/3-demethylubiquinol 3-O-methyltransferase UbiG, partial [Methylophilaceae bacterium]
MAKQNTVNVDPSEVEKFNQIAHKWWDPTSEFKPLHDINPLRLNFINQNIPLKDKKVLDVGCGGGILSESMAQLGAEVTGLDQSEIAIKIAQLHAKESN